MGQVPPPPPRGIMAQIISFMDLQNFHFLWKVLWRLVQNIRGWSTQCKNLTTVIQIHCLLISIGNSTVCSGGSWYFGEFWNITRGIYPKYPHKTVLSPVYTTRERNFALSITHKILFSHVQLIGFTNMWSLKHHATLMKLYSNVSKCQF